jgi:molybdate transport repressor ModE-like protein
MLAARQLCGKQLTIIKIMSYPNRWLGTEVRHLIALEAVAATGSFSGAARQLGYTQSAISLQIGQLERISGNRLVDRRGGRHPVTLTPAGRRLVRHSRAVLDQIRAAEADLAALAAGAAGIISLGTFQSISARLLPGSLRRLRNTRPLVEVQLNEAPHEEQLGLLAAGQIDLAFVLLPVDGPFHTRELMPDPFIFISPADSPAGYRVPSLTQLARRSLISWQHGPLSFEAVLRAHGHEPRVVLRTDDRVTVQELVAAGLGAAVIPRLALRLPDPRLSAVDVSRHIPPRKIGLAWHRDREPQPGMHALIGSIEAEAQEAAR